jgi:hypothetical protein
MPRGFRRRVSTKATSTEPGAPPSANATSTLIMLRIILATLALLPVAVLGQSSAYGVCCFISYLMSSSPLSDNMAAMRRDELVSSPSMRL